MIKKPLDDKGLFELVNDLSTRHFEKPFKHDVIFNHRLRTTGGRYIPSKRRIELNPKYMMEMGVDEFIGIIKHELCHYHLHITGKGYKHGDKAFKDLLRFTNSPRFCRQLPSEAKKRKHQYRCRKCLNVYHRTRRVNVTKYRCGKCKGKLKLIESIV